MYFSCKSRHKDRSTRTFVCTRMCALEGQPHTCLSPRLAFTLMTRGNWPSQMTLTRYCEAIVPTQLCILMLLPQLFFLYSSEVSTDLLIKQVPVCVGTIR